MTTTALTVSPGTALKILKLLLDGRGPAFVAAAVNSSPDEVEAVATANGWPDRRKAEWAVDELTRQLDGRDRLPAASTVEVASPAPTAAAAPAPTALAVVTDTDVLAGLVARARKSPSKRVQAAADKAEAAVTRLRELLEEEEQKKKANAEAAAERQKAKEKIARLKRELAEAERILKGGSPVTKPARSGPSAKAVRAWAAEVGIEVSPIGRVPGDIVEQYLDAHPEVTA